MDAQAEGELTGDGLSDIAVVLRSTDPMLVVRNDGLGGEQIDTNPRQLLVFERTAQGFRQIAVATKAIPPAGSIDNSCLDDPLVEGGISIARRVLSVKLHYWESCGSWGVSTNTYKFKQIAGRFRMIGFDRTEFTRNLGEGEEVSVNFLTLRKSTAPFNIEDSVRERPRWSRIKPLKIYLDTFDIDACPMIDSKTYLC